MNDDIENTLRDALDQRRSAASEGSPLTSQHGNIDDVYDRVDRRRSRRRSVAVLGSVGIIALGGVGLAMIDRGDPPAASYEGALGEPSATTYVIQPGLNVWACTGELGYDASGAALFSSCVPTSYAPNGQIEVAATGCEVWTVPTTMVYLDANYAIDTTPEGLDVTIPAVMSVPAATVPYLVDEGCIVPVATAPATTALGELWTTTTSIFYSEGSSPPQFSEVDCRSALDPSTATTTTTTTTTMPPATTVGMIAHTVVPNDSLFSIAAQYGVDVEILANFNAWPDCLGHVIFVGDVVYIPPV